MLLLVFTLVLLSVAKPSISKKINENEWTKVIQYYTQKIDDNDILTIDSRVDNSYTNKPIYAFRPLREGTSIEDKSFSSLPKEEITNLKIAQYLSQYQVRCQQQDYYSMRHQALLGYTIKAIKDIDIVPSMTWLIAKSPEKVTYIDKDGDTRNVVTGHKCASERNPLDYYGFTLKKYGVASTECFVNNQVPVDTTKCTNESDPEAQPDVIMKGYRDGIITGNNATTMKLALTRFGVVANTQGYAYGIIFGWEDDNWLLAPFEYDQEKFEVTKVPINGSEYHEGEVIFNEDFAIDCSSEIQADTIQDVCPCPIDKKDLEKDPRYFKGGICYSGSMRVTLSVITTTMLLPILVLLL